MRLKEQTTPLDWSQGDRKESHFPYSLCGWCKYLKYRVLIVKLGITLLLQKIEACQRNTAAAQGATQRHPEKMTYMVSRDHWSGMKTEDCSQL